MKQCCDYSLVERFQKKTKKKKNFTEEKKFSIILSLISVIETEVKVTTNQGIKRNRLFKLLTE